MSQAAAAGLAGCARRATPSFAVLVLLLAPWLLRGQLSASASRPRDCVARSELTSCSAESTSEQVPCVGAQPPASQLARWAAASASQPARQVYGECAHRHGQLQGCLFAALTAFEDTLGRPSGPSVGTIRQRLLGFTCTCTCGCKRSQKLGAHQKEAPVLARFFCTSSSMSRPDLPYRRRRFQQGPCRQNWSCKKIERAQELPSGEPRASGRV